LRLSLGSSRSRNLGPWSVLRTDDAHRQEQSHQTSHRCAHTSSQPEVYQL
jgi:hypothetical protein